MLTSCCNFRAPERDYGYSCAAIQTSRRIDNKAKYANLGDNCAREMESDPSDGGDCGDPCGDLIISKIFAAHDDFFHRAAPRWSLSFKQYTLAAKS